MAAPTPTTIAVKPAFAEGGAEGAGGACNMDRHTGGSKSLAGDCLDRADQKMLFASFSIALLGLKVYTCINDDMRKSQVKLWCHIGGGSITKSNPPDIIYSM